MIVIVSFKLSIIETCWSKVCKTAGPQSPPCIVIESNDISLESLEALISNCRRGRTFFNLVPTHKLGADNTRILAKFSFEFILLYELAPKLGADQSVCRYMFSRACVNVRGLKKILPSGRFEPGSPAVRRSAEFFSNLEH